MVYVFAAAIGVYSGGVGDDDDGNDWINVVSFAHSHFDVM
jgi:hypothetical protein